MDHPLPLATWRSDCDRLDSDLDLNMQHLDVNSQPRSDVIGDIDIDESESDRPSQWIRADSTSSSRSTLLSDLSADAGKSSPDMQWEVVGGHAHDNGHGHDNDGHSQDDGHGHSHDHHDHSDQQDIYPPKAEPDEYDFCLEDVQPVTPAKRPRGRPRKPSMSSATGSGTATGAAAKIAKARSKTGCTTCRRRKKKCDETKPVCLNCEKNAVVCEGYKEKHVWKSGRERAAELKNQSHAQALDITLQPIFMGMEGREDRLIWHYYLDHVSNVFTADGAHDNVFRTTVVPLATTHQAMMHSVLSLASRHINFDSPHVQKLLRRSPKVSPESLQNRGSHHNSEALTRLSRGMYHSMHSAGSAHTQYKTPDALAARYAQMLFLVLESLAEGQRDGAQRLHYEFFLYMLERFPPAESEFYSFISEIFYYHIYADDLLYCPLQTKARLVVGDWVPAMPLAPARLLGVVDGLFNYLSQITSIRNRIRARVQAGADPRIDYDSLYRASALECQIHDWKPEWAPGDSRNRATLLYQQMAWLYLKTTVCPPQVHSFPRADDAVPSGSTTCASSPGPLTSAIDMDMADMIPAANNFSNPRRHSIAHPSLASGSRPFLPKIVSFAVVEDDEDEAETRETRKESPPPVRRPANHESAVAVAVKEALALLESFAPDDPCQTLLLVPCVVVGTACYAPDDQARIRTAIHRVHGHTGLRHTGLALELVERVWQLMGQGDFLGAWDWQTVAYHLGMQHLF